MSPQPPADFDFVSHSEEETLAWAARFASQLRPGDIVALSGNLGAGKTVVCRGLVKALANEADVHSPTYALVHEYPGTIPIFHMDLYRLAPGSDWHEIGLDHYFNQNGICLVEWPERLPKGDGFTYWVSMKVLDSDSRHIQVTLDGHP